MQAAGSTENFDNYKGQASYNFKYISTVSDLGKMKDVRIEGKLISRLDKSTLSSVFNSLIIQKLFRGMSYKILL